MPGHPGHATRKLTRQYIPGSSARQGWCGNRQNGKPPHRGCNYRQGSFQNNHTTPLVSILAGNLPTGRIEFPQWTIPSRILISPGCGVRIVSSDVPPIRNFAGFKPSASIISGGNLWDSVPGFTAAEKTCTAAMPGNPNKQFLKQQFGLYPPDPNPDPAIVPGFLHALCP